MKSFESFYVFLILLLVPLMSLGDRINISQTNGESFWPALACNTDGVLMAVFTENVEGSNDIYMSLSYDGGNSWTTPQRTYSRQNFVKACALDADKYGNFHMCYSDGWGSGGREIYYRYYASGSWQGAERLSFSNDNSNWCRISADGNEVHVIWYQEIGWPAKPYIALKSKPIGGAWPSSTVDVSRDTSNGAISPDVKAKDGNIYGIYRVQVYSGETLLGKHIGISERLNGTWHGPTKIGYYNWPDVDVDEYNNVHCLFPNGGYVEYRAKIDGSWQETEWLNEWGGIACFFDIKYGNNTLIAAYMLNNGNGNHYSIYTSKKEFNGSWGSWSAPAELDPGEYAELPKLAIDNNGTVHVIWVDVGNGGEMDIYYKNLSLPGQDNPSIQLDTASMVFDCVAGTTATPETFQIRNSGISTLNYTVDTNQSWLSVSPQSGFSDGEWDPITVYADASSLSKGEYTGTITVSSTEASNSPRNIAVTFRVGSEEPSIVFDREGLYFSHTKGNSNPSSQYFQIKNSGLGTLNYQISCDKSWTTFLPSTGASTGEWDAVSVTVNAESLSVGNHSATITIASADADNSPQTLPVSVSINQGELPAFQVDKASLTFLYSHNSPAPQPQILRIRNSNTGTLNYQVSKNKDWMSVTPTSGSSTGEWDNLSVSIAYTGILTATQKGTITITSPNASNSPQTISVILKKQGPTIQLNKTSTAFTGIYRQDNPDPKEFSIKNSGSDILDYQLISNRDWLWATPSQGSSTGEWETILACVDTSSLEMGSYEGTITVTSSNATNTPQVFTVYLTVKKPDLPYTPLNVQGQRINNEGLFIKIYVNKIRWEKNPKNFDIYDINTYKIYRKKAAQTDASYVLLGEVPASNFLEYVDEFSDRQIRDLYDYAVTSMSVDWRESHKAAALFISDLPPGTQSERSTQKKKIEVKRHPLS